MSAPEPQRTSSLPRALPVAKVAGHDAAQEDLYCLECGYNLRGIAGDPRRCPECWYANSVADMRIPAQLIRKQARKLETLPTVCVAWVLAIPLVLGLAASPMAGATFALGAGLTVIAAWGATGYYFAKSCQFRPGWAIALLEMHLVALMLLPPLLGALPCLVLLAIGPRLQALAMLITGILMCVIGALAYRDARRRLVQLRRLVAVMLAKRELARRG
ncbi:MAG: hypothetical protein ACYSVY_03550 [Planctomycetota bacterium]